MSYTDAPIPNNPNAKFAAWRLGQEERTSRLENRNSFTPVPLCWAPVQLASSYFSFAHSGLSMVQAYQSRHDWPYYDAVVVEAGFNVSAGSTMALNITANSADGNKGTPETIIGLGGGGATGTMRWEWTHGVLPVPFDVGNPSTAFNLYINVRRASGTVQNVSVLMPSKAYFIPSQLLQNPSTGPGWIL